MPKQRLTASAAAAFLATLFHAGLSSATADPADIAPGAPAATEAPKLSPRDAGARYGQALGVIEICHGSKVTDAGKALSQNFAGPDQDVFKAQAAKVYEAWHKVKNCSKALDPNECKIIMDKSCAAAEAEIGAVGTVMPGLVEFMKR